MMLPRKTPRRACRDHEREWNGYCVDKGLEDSWLVSLNGLAAFDLISICEGHCDRRTDPPRTPPHVKLRLKERLLPGVARRWDEHKMAVLDAVNGLFQTGDTYVNLELKFKLRSATGRFNYQEEFILRVHGREVRSTDTMDAQTRDWFLKTVERIESLDHLVGHMWQGVEQDAG
jgi:hypothetical protein